MYIWKTKSFLCFLSLYLLHPSFPLPPKPFLFYYQIPQRSLVSVVLHGSDLLIHNHLDDFSADSEIALMAFLFILLSYLVDLEFCVKIFLPNLGSQLLSDNMLSVICWICIVLQAPDIFQAFIRRPLPYFPPTGLSILSAQPVLFRLTRELNPDAGQLLRSAPELSIVPRYLLSTASFGRKELILHAEGAGFAGFEEVYWPRHQIEDVRTDCSVHCIGHRPRYLVMSPTVPSIT